MIDLMTDGICHSIYEEIDDLNPHSLRSLGLTEITLSGVKKIKRLFFAVVYTDIIGEAKVSRMIVFKSLLHLLSNYERLRVSNVIRLTYSAASQGWEIGKISQDDLLEAGKLRDETVGYTCYLYEYDQ